MALRLISGVLLGAWLLLVLMGKGGMVHILFLNGISIGLVEAVCLLRRRVHAR